MRTSFFSRLALALLAVTGVFVPVVENATFDQVTIDGARSRKETPTGAPSSRSTAERAPQVFVEREPLAPGAPRGATPKRFLLHRAWLN